MSNATSFRALVLAALKAGDGFKSALEALQARAETMEYLDYRNQLAPIVGEKVGETPYESKKGGLTFEKNSAGEQRMKRLLRLHPASQSGGKNHKEETEIPAELLEAARKLVKLAQEYQHAKSLASKALATAFAE